MMEPLRTALSIQFENGDSLTVSCDVEKNQCRLALTVNGQEFQYGVRDLDAEPIPESGHLYSGAFSGREEHFSFAVSAICPNEVDSILPYSCTVSGVVIEGELVDINVIENE